MACKFFARGRVALVVWGKPELRDLQYLHERVQRVHEVHGPVIFIARVPADAEAPADDVRAAISKFLAGFVELCLGYHAVFEGGGFVSAAKRTVLATIFLMSSKRSRYHVHASCDQVVDAVPLEHRAEVRKALDGFQAQGLLTLNLEQLPI